MKRGAFNECLKKHDFIYQFHRATGIKINCMEIGNLFFIYVNMESEITVEFSD